MVFRTLRRQTVGSCLFLELVRPGGEAPARRELSSELAEVCAELGWEDEIRAVVLSFDGEAVPEARGPEDPLEVFTPSFVEAIAQVGKPVIGAIRGDAVGVALELAMACDLRLGTTGARFGLSQVRSGRIPSDGGTQRLHRLVGPGRALELVLLGETIDADEAQRIGLVNRVVEPAALSSAALAMAQDLALISPVAIRVLKEAVHRGLDLTLEQGLRMELDLYLLLFSTEDRTEGITAFKEKRPPTFEGK